MWTLWLSETVFYFACVTLTLTTLTWRGFLDFNAVKVGLHTNDDIKMFMDFSLFVKIKTVPGKKFCRSSAEQIANNTLAKLDLDNFLWFWESLWSKKLQIHQIKLSLTLIIQYSNMSPTWANFANFAKVMRTREVKELDLPDSPSKFVSSSSSVSDHFAVFLGCHQDITNIHSLYHRSPWYHIGFPSFIVKCHLVHKTL